MTVRRIQLREETLRDVHRDISIAKNGIEYALERERRAIDIYEKPDPLSPNNNGKR